MDKQRFKTLVEDFEKNIVVSGLITGKLHHLMKRKLVSTKRGKLSNKNFGKMLGKTINTDTILVIDYYGYFKRSRGFIKMMKKNGQPYPDELHSNVIHFPSIRMEDIASMTHDITVMLDFPRLKNEILILRGFRRRPPVKSNRM